MQKELQNKSLKEKQTKEIKENQIKVKLKNNINIDWVTYLAWEIFVSEEVFEKIKSFI